VFRVSRVSRTLDQQCGTLKLAMRVCQPFPCGAVAALAAALHLPRKASEQGREPFDVRA
jgi:hypothetical protein